MRVIRLAAAIACILLGGVVGALNTAPVLLDLGIISLRASSGLSMLLALSLGVVVGGTILAIGVVAPLRRRLRRAEATARSASTGH